MPEARSWLGIRLQWSYHVSQGRGEYRAARFAYNKERLRWLKSNKMVTVAIFDQDHSLELYDTVEPGEVPGLCPFWRVDRYIFSLAGLSEFARWPTTEAIYSEFTGIDLSENFRTVFRADAVLRKWQSYGICGWYVIERGGAGVTLVRELADIRDGSLRAVEVSSDGVSMYRHDLLRGSDMHEAEMIMHFQTMHLDMPRLQRVFRIEDVISIRQAVRHYHLVIHELAIEYGLPF